MNHIVVAALTVVLTLWLNATYHATEADLRCEAFCRHARATGEFDYNILRGRYRVPDLARHRPGVIRNLARAKAEIVAEWMAPLHSTTRRKGETP